jgi:hypothetical protein
MYNVYRCCDGCAEEFFGRVETLDEAAKLIAGGRTLPECLYSTAEAAGHCGGIRAPEKDLETDEVYWLGEYDCAVEVENDRD